MRRTSPAESPAPGTDELPEPAPSSIHDSHPTTWRDRVLAIASFVTVFSGLAWTCAVFYRSRPYLPDGGGLFTALAGVHWELPAIIGLAITAVCAPRSFWD